MAAAAATAGGRLDETTRLAAVEAPNLRRSLFLRAGGWPGWPGFGGALEGPFAASPPSPRVASSLGPSWKANRGLAGTRSGLACIGLLSPERLLAATSCAKLSTPSACYCREGRGGARGKNLERRSSNAVPCRDRGQNHFAGFFVWTLDERASPGSYRAGRGGAGRLRHSHPGEAETKFFRLACSFPPSGSPVALLARPPLVYRFIGRVPPAGAVRGRGACVSEVLKQGDLIAMAIRKTANSRPRAPRSRGVPLLRPHGQPASLLTPAMRFEFARVDEYEAGGRAGRHELSKASPSVPPPQAPAGHWDDWEGTLASAGNSGRDEGGAGRFTDGVMDLLFVVSCRVAPARAAPACLSTMPPSGTHRTYLTSFPAHQQRHPHRRLPGRPPITAPRRRNPPTLCRGRSRLGQSCAKTPGRDPEIVPLSSRNSIKPPSAGQATCLRYPFHTGPPEPHAPVRDLLAWSARVWSLETDDGHHTLRDAPSRWKCK
ncbi:hypothetical protein ACCO45_005380 [Purpureocillium lilacinum]|uniref:Uncharacterized protein n=1 Tax=Purpureocillium lilacinum TaxID=33203 RepID=A0ACC4DYB5_PURLI